MKGIRARGSEIKLSSSLCWKDTAYTMQQVQWENGIIQGKSVTQ